MDNLENVIIAVLFATGRYVSYSELSQTLKVDLSEIEKKCESIISRFDDESPVKAVKIRSGLQLVTNKKYYEYISLFVENTKKQTLSPAVLETLTIIAYNPKITKSDVEKIRGVNSDFAVARLLEAGLIEEVARLNLPGKQAVYSVTDEFLKSTGIEKNEDLPEFENLKLNDEQMMINDINKEKWYVNITFRKS